MFWLWGLTGAALQQNVCCLQMLIGMPPTSGITETPAKFSLNAHQGVALNEPKPFLFWGLH